MAYKDPAKQREYQRLWMAARRKKWFTENGPCVDCDTWNDLELDHVDPKQKISHNVWSWSEHRRLAELAKCVVRCTSCHQLKTTTNHEYGVGENHHSAKISDVVVEQIRENRKTGTSYRNLAKIFDISTMQAWNICNYIQRKQNIAG